MAAVDEEEVLDDDRSRDDGRVANNRPNYDELDFEESFLSLERQTLKVFYNPKPWSLIFHEWMIRTHTRGSHSCKTCRAIHKTKSRDQDLICVNK